MEESLALLIFNHIPKLGNKKAQALIAYFGSASSVLKAPFEKINCALNCEELSYNLSNWAQFDSWKKDIELVKRHGISLIPYNHPSYPSSLHCIEKFPLLLYVKGELLKDTHSNLAIVGTRKASYYGREMAQKIASDLAKANLTIVSGLASGIDTYAHLGALSSGKTLAVLGSGLANIYPKENEELAKQIERHGALISEFPMTARPLKHQFPQRNGIIAGLSSAALLIEAPLESGAMITMDLALAQNKPCFALPGRADLDSFKGNHDLIKKKKASLIEDSQELLSALEYPFIAKMEQTDIFFSSHLTEDECTIISFLSQEEISIEALAIETKWPLAKLNAQLIKLVLKGKIVELPGKLYRIRR